MDALRTLGQGLLATLRDRVDLLSLELQEEKFRLIQTFVWISMVIFAGTMAVVFSSLTIVYLFWESARLAALGSFALLYLGATIGMVIAFRRFLRRQPRPLAATLEELETDRACIRRPN